MKKINKTPIEIFGFDCESKDSSFKLALKQQYCKYIKATCIKPRKSEPEVKVGICTLGSTVNKSSENLPVIVCPQRFKEDSMFETIRKLYLSNWRNVKWVQEVNLGVGGNVDYVAVELDFDENIKDFLCVELQAAGTTGSPYPAVEEFRRTGHFFKTSYDYGINWANEFAKTMMQQAYKKGKIVETWNRKIVFVVQDVAMKYLMKSTDCSKLVESNPNFPVDFCTFSLNWNEKDWKLDFDKIYSADIDGINTILGGAAVNEYPTEKEFIVNIIRKGISDGVFKKRTN